MTTDKGRPQPDTTPGGDAGARLERLLGDQAELCERLWSLAQQQGELVAAGRGDEVLGVLSERQGVVERIVEISGQLDPFRRDWDRVRDGLDEGRRERVRELTERIDTLLGRIDERDRADRAVLEQRRTGVAGELGAVRHSRGAIAAYGGGAGGGGGGAPRYQDREA